MVGNLRIDSGQIDFVAKIVLFVICLCTSAPLESNSNYGHLIPNDTVHPHHSGVTWAVAYIRSHYTLRAFDLIHTGVPIQSIRAGGIKPTFKVQVKSTRCHRQAFHLFKVITELLLKAS